MNAATSPLMIKGQARPIATRPTAARRGQSVATGKQKPVTVVAFKLCTCHGTLMYKAVEWYFPKEGQAFSPGRYENICSGRYVPGS